jgi:hypothetical protein
LAHNRCGSTIGIAHRYRAAPALVWNCSGKSAPVTSQTVLYLARPGRQLPKPLIRPAAAPAWQPNAIFDAPSVRPSPRCSEAPVGPVFTDSGKSPARSGSRWKKSSAAHG